MLKIVDLTGMRFGKLVVLEFHERKKYSKKDYKYIWKCQCDCGNIAFVDRANLKSGCTKSCGCLRVIKGQRKFKDLTNKRFGRLIAIKVDHTKPIGNNKVRYYWLCNCDCGNTAVVPTSDLISTHTQSCGCYANDLKEEILKKAWEATKLKRFELTDEEYTKRLVLRNYKREANKRNIKFLLNDEEFFDLILSEQCFYCGNGPNIYVNKSDRIIKWMGVDRIDSDKGYCIENCIPCCGRCNQGKMSESQENFLLWIERIYNNLIKDKIMI